MSMKELLKNTEPQCYSEQREVRIGKTVYVVNSIFKGDKHLEKVLIEWTVKKALATANS